MGMYTELIFGANLRSNTPKEVIDTLRYMAGDIEKPEKLAFETSPGRNPINGTSSFYFGVSRPLCKMWFDEISDEWIISSRCNIKNYENEIESFLEWIKPYIDGGSGDRDMYAIKIYEESSEPTIYYLYDKD